MYINIYKMIENSKNLFNIRQDDKLVFVRNSMIFGIMILFLIYLLYY